jgi:hypothetical protein
MSTVVFLIEQIAIALYIFIGVGIIIQWRNWSQANWSYRSTQFELERDISRYRSANAATGFILLIEAVLIVFGIQNIVAPTLRRMEPGISVQEQLVTDIDFFTPTPGLRATVPFNSDGVIFEAVNPADQPVLTATPRPTAVGTIVANMPDPIGCDGTATLLIPANGMKIFQITEIVGTAFTDNFAQYKLEIKGPGTNDTYHTLEGNTNPVTTEASLGQFNPSPYEPGEYEFRVVVFDTTTTMRASCTMNIVIEDPQPTRTPVP